jgi:1-acyl-sn-glycerol-3-phosphate acyltransferase
MLFYRLSSWAFWIVYGVLYHHKVEWEFDPAELTGPVIVAPNHVSYLDPQLVLQSWPGCLHFFAGNHLFARPLLRWLLRHLCCHPVTRGKELAAIRAALALLREGNKVVLFPEGTRSGDGTLKPLRSGVAFLAEQSQSPIVPCYVGGSYEAWPRTRKWPRLFGVRTVCRFGRPILPTDPSGARRSKETLNEMLQQSLSRLSSGPIPRAH